MRASPRIAYVVATPPSVASGLGGHYYDVRAIAEALSSAAETHIIHIGDRESSALRSTTVPVHHIPFTLSTSRKALDTVSRLIGILRPDVLHAFDIYALLCCRLVNRKNGTPLVFTKCGGPNPTGYFPWSRDVIVYSAENRSYFESNRRYANSRIWVIPQRVAPVESDRHRICELKQYLNPKRHVLIRIGRFSPDYRDTLLQIITLVDDLNATGTPTQALMIGIVEQLSVYQEIKSLAGRNGLVICDPRYTTDAHRLLDLGDAVVGTGRGLMEAASVGKVLLTPLAGSSHPVLLTPDTFRAAMKTNFSPRNKVDGFSTERNLEAIRIALSNPTVREEHERMARSLFEQHFDVNRAIPTYLAAYREALNKDGSVGPEATVDLVRHAAHVVHRLTKRRIAKALGIVDWVTTEGAGVQSQLPPRLGA